jgi:hypothetical protein
MVVSVRLLVAAALAFCAMGLAANHAFLERVHARPGCSSVSTTGGSVLESCHAGWFKGAPDLTARRCTPVGLTGRVDYWSCPA